MTWPWQKRRLNRAHLAQERLELMGRIGRLELSLSRYPIPPREPELRLTPEGERLRREQDHRNGSAFRKAGGTVR